MNRPFDFSGKTVFVAGGSSGINLAIAEAFAEHGASVAIASRSRERVDAAVARLRAHGGKAEGFVADVRDPEAVDAAIGAAHGLLGPIDVLVSGAAGNFVAPALNMSSNAFRTVVDIDLNGTFNVLRHGYRYLRRPGASVISLSAPQAFNPTRFQAHVCAAKAGIDMLTRVLAMEWGGDGVRVNSIVPGPIGDTEGVQRLAPNEEARRRMMASIPLGRFGGKRDVANLARFLCSEMGSCITGAVIPVDGGSSLPGGRDLGSVDDFARR
jgi:NAD(P)-dependent dehydrogenase (short-subunit alcohol dehydrogenase family)